MMGGYNNFHNCRYTKANKVYPLAVRSKTIQNCTSLIPKCNKKQQSYQTFYIGWIVCYISNNTYCMHLLYIIIETCCFQMYSINFIEYISPSHLECLSVEISFSADQSANIICHLRPLCYTLCTPLKNSLVKPYRTSAATARQLMWAWKH